MNERIRELAQAAGLGFHGESITMLQDELPETVLGRFAELIAAAEREECALQSMTGMMMMGMLFLLGSFRDEILCEQNLRTPV